MDKTKFVFSTLGKTRFLDGPWIISWIGRDQYMGEASLLVEALCLLAFLENLSDFICPLHPSDLFGQLGISNSFVMHS